MIQMDATAKPISRKAPFLGRLSFRSDWCSVIRTEQLSDLRSTTPFVRVRGSFLTDQSTFGCVTGPLFGEHPTEKISKAVLGCVKGHLSIKIKQGPANAGSTSDLFQLSHPFFCLVCVCVCVRSGGLTLDDINDAATWQVSGSSVKPRTLQEPRKP